MKRNRIIKGLLSIAAGIAVLAAIAYGGEQFAERYYDKKYEPPGEFIKIAGNRIHYRVEGSEGPSVVIEPGLGHGVLEWLTVQDKSAKFARVLSYDRAGYGWSSYAKGSRSPEEIVEELHVLLKKSGLPEPYVFVGHSIGGQYVRLYADRYPEEVKGVVLVDARHEAYSTLMKAEEEKNMKLMKRQLQIGSFLSSFGVHRLVGEAMLPDYYPEDVKPIRNHFGFKDRFMEALKAEIAQTDETAALLKASEFNEQWPLVVIRHGKPMPNAKAERAWVATQKQLAALSATGKVIVAEDSGHDIHMEQPEVVVEAIREMANLD
ncbi:MAG TPA: alpha/beta hydrolase [Bacillales bacterium]|nr:alpha/beta hydrolase [Bacillales bacterium]